MRSQTLRTAATAARWTAAILLVAYAGVIARLTLWPASQETSAFGMLYRTVTQLSGGRLDWSVAEVIGNVALFVPAGFLLAIVLGRAWLSVLLCLIAACAIELAQRQWLPSRVPTLDDVRHNGMGGLIGALLAWPIALGIRRVSADRDAPPPLASPAAGFPAA